jgi:hypothetical protein
LSAHRFLETLSGKSLAFTEFPSSPRTKNISPFQKRAFRAEALELARQLPPGPKRNEALKAAGRLRCYADARGIVFAKRGRPRK